MSKNYQSDGLLLLVSILESRVELASVGGEVGAPTSDSAGV